MKRFALLMMLAIALRCYAQWAENKHSEEMTTDEREMLYARKKAAREAEAAVEQVRNQIRANHGQGDHRSVEIFESEGFVVITEKSADN